MSYPTLFVRGSFLLGLLALCPERPQALPQVRKLSGPMALGLTGDVDEEQASPDGTRVVYLADQDRQGHNELYSVPSDRSSPPVKLNDALAGSVSSFAIAPDGSRVVYVADRQFTVHELFSVPIDGSAAPVKLNDPFVSGGDAYNDYGRNFVITHDSARVVFIADALVDVRYELFSVPIDRSSAPVKLSGTLVAGGGVPPSIVLNGLLQVSPDSSRVLYVAEAQVNDRLDLYVVPADGSAAPVELSRVLNPSGAVSHLALTPDGTLALYSGDQQADGEIELFRVPLDGSANPLKLSPSFLGFAWVNGFELSPDGARAAFVVTRSGHDEVYGVPSDGSAPAVLLNGAPGTGINVYEFEVSPDSSRVVYTGTRPSGTGYSDLFSVPLDGSAAPLRLNGPQSADDFLQGFVSFTPDSARVLYVADQVTNSVYELFSVPLDGSQLPVRLNPAITQDKDVAHNNVASNASGDRVFFRLTFDLFSVPADGSAAALQLDTPSQETMLLTYVAATDQVLYRFRRPGVGSDSVFEIASVPAAGGTPVVLNDTMTGGPAGDVQVFSASPDGRWAVYLANQDDPGSSELFSARSDASTGPLRLHAALGGHVRTHAISPDSASVAFVADHDTPGYNELYAVPIDGHLAPLKLSGGLRVSTSPAGPRISPDGSRVVFRSIDSALQSVPLDGSLPPTQLTTGSAVQEFEISPDSSHVVFRTTALYSVPLAGGQAPQLLSNDTSFFVTDWRISPDSAWVVYRRSEFGRFELYGVPIDGSLAATLFDARETSPDYAILPDSTGIVFRADPEEVGWSELYRAPIEGGVEPTKLNAPLVTNGNVLGFQLSPDGAFVAYRAAQDHAGMVELYGVPTDGSAAPIRLSAPMSAVGDVNEVAFAPDGNRVVYRADPEVNFHDELFSAHADGSGDAVRLDPLPLFADMGGFAISPRGGPVLYRVASLEDQRFELFAVTLDGSRPMRINSELDVGGDVEPDFLVLGERVLYRADQDLDGVFELYERPLGRGARESGPPQNH